MESYIFIFVIILTGWMVNETTAPIIETKRNKKIVGVLCYVPWVIALYSIVKEITRVSKKGPKFPSNKMRFGV